MKYTSRNIYDIYNIISIIYIICVYMLRSTEAF